MTLIFLVGSANDAGRERCEPSGYALGVMDLLDLGFFGFVFAFLLRRARRGAAAPDSEGRVHTRLRPAPGAR
jgi:hypothetical protein